MNDFLLHLKAMGNLEGQATDYPIMFVVYLGIFVACLITTSMLLFSKYGKRVIWLPDQHKVIKSKFSYMAMLACTFTGVFLVGSFPSELQKTYGTWNADFFYTIGQTSVMIAAGIYALATYKEKRSTVSFRIKASFPIFTKPNKNNAMTRGPHLSRN